MELINYFSYSEGNLLIRILIAHFLADFAFQTTNMVKEKKFLSKQMGYHIMYVIAIAFILMLPELVNDNSIWSVLILILGIAGSHWIIDSLKIEIEAKQKLLIDKLKASENNTEKRDLKEQIISPVKIFVIDQLLHLFFILLAWLLYEGIQESVKNIIIDYLTNYKISLIAIGYLIVIFPIRYLVEKITKTLESNIDSSKKVQKTPQQEKEEEELEHGGKWIGVFERIIILTFVLFGEYEAIGFLITGKSILRLNTKKQTEYVLVGTMASYALAIATGVLINWLLTIK